MLWTRRRAALGFLVFLATSGALVEAASNGRTAAIEALAARATPVALVAPRVPAASPGFRSPFAICPGGGSSEPCFEPASARLEFVNVASFFDRSRRAGASDYFAKYFAPATPGRYRILGFTFKNDRAGSVFPHAGVVVTNAETPFFPTSEDLRLLPILDVEGLGPDSVSCVDVRSLQIDIEANQAAWLVIHMPADTAFAGIRADVDSTDHPCDFMTRDSGDYWYRPDPRQSFYDWEITPYFEALPARAENRVPWSAVKKLFR